VRDALPDFINHRLSDLDAVTISEHIESCADCRAEVAILRDIMKSRPLAPVMNVDHLSAAIPAYAPLRSRSTGFPMRRTWALAAAAAFVAIGGWAITNRTTDTSAPAVAVNPPATATTTSNVPTTATQIVTGAEKTVAKVENAARETQAASLSLVGSTDDLSDSDLETLVAALDGIETVPSAEPGSVTTTVDDIDGTDDQ
jgi:hypothetical protein